MRSNKIIYLFLFLPLLISTACTNSEPTKTASAPENPAHQEIETPQQAKQKPKVKPTSTPKDFIACDFDGVKKEFNQEAYSQYHVELKLFTIVGANGKEFINISLPSNATGEFINEYTNKDKTVTSAPNLIYGIYGDKAVQMYESNYFEEGSVKINITNLDENHVEGTASGVITEYDSVGFKPDHKIALENCSFSVKRYKDIKF